MGLLSQAANLKYFCTPNKTNRMSLLRSLLFIFFIGISFSAFSQKTIQNAELKTLDGQTINLFDVFEEGKTYILSFWATWCAPCKKELDAIADLYPQWQEDYDVELIAITIDTRRALSKVPSMVASKNWEYTILSDVNQQLKNQLNFQAIPQTFVIDKDRKITYSHSGYVPGDEYELEEHLSKMEK
jgi:peroxiredoxin